MTLLRYQIVWVFIGWCSLLPLWLNEYFKPPQLTVKVNKVGEEQNLIWGCYPSASCFKGWRRSIRSIRQFKCALDWTGRRTGCFCFLGSFISASHWRRACSAKAIFSPLCKSSRNELFSTKFVSSPPWKSIQTNLLMCSKTITLTLSLEFQQRERSPGTGAVWDSLNHAACINSSPLSLHLHPSLLIANLPLKQHLSLLGPEGFSFISAPPALHF